MEDGLAGRQEKAASEEMVGVGGGHLKFSSWSLNSEGGDL